MMLSKNFWNWKQAQKKVNHCSKKERKGEKQKARKNYLNIKKPSDISHFLLSKF